MVVQVAVVLKVAMRPLQSVLYQWVKETGTIRLDPAGAVMRPSVSHPLG